LEARYYSRRPTISTGIGQVPRVIGLSKDEAATKFRNERLELRTETKSGGKKPGTIVDQNPEPDKPVAPGTIITAFVLPEPEMVSVPDVIGVPAEKVAPMFEGRKLEYYVIGQRIITGKVPVGAIAHQSPEAGQRVRVGTRVELAAEAESVQVPDLRGIVVMEAVNSVSSISGARLTRVAKPLAVILAWRRNHPSPEPASLLVPPSPCAQNRKP
jgi:beta-lactam-binding protein with PASTA domain